MSMFFKDLTFHRDFFVKNGQKVDYKKGQYIVTASDENNWVYFLADGLVKISFTSNAGDGRLIGYFLPGMTFAQSSSFFAANTDGMGPEYCAIVPTTAYRISREVFMNQIKQDPDFNEDYIQALLRNQLFLIDRIVYQGEKGIYARCIRWILFMVKYYADPDVNSKDSYTIAVPLTQETAAEFMHVTRESVSAAYGKLLSKGLITISKKRITIPSLAKLSAELN